MEAFAIIPQLDTHAAAKLITLGTTAIVSDVGSRNLTFVMIIPSCVGHIGFWIGRNRLITCAMSS